MKMWSFPLFNMNYYISDLHFFSKNQTAEGLNFDNRPFKNVDEMHEVILNNWNSRVTNGDTVYILGDVSNRGKNEDLIAIVARLKGKKVLIKGNHCDASDYRYKQLFYSIHDYLEITDYADKKAYRLVLSHYPILMWNGQHNGAILLYGHTHKSIEDIYFHKCISEMNNLDFSIRRPHEKEIKAINVGCMMPYMNYTPRTLEEILVSNK